MCHDLELARAWHSWVTAFNDARFGFPAVLFDAMLWERNASGMLDICLNSCKMRDGWDNILFPMWS